MPVIVSKLKRKLRKTDTLERCGLVLLDNKVVELKNVHEFPEQAFCISAKDVVAHEDNMVGTWHTHPGQTANLSQEDHSGFKQWPSLTHYIIGIDGVRAFRMDGPLMVEVDLD